MRKEDVELLFENMKISSLGCENDKVKLVSLNSFKDYYFTSSNDKIYICVGRDILDNVLENNNLTSYSDIIPQYIMGGNTYDDHDI